MVLARNLVFLGLAEALTRNVKVSSDMDVKMILLD